MGVKRQLSQSRMQRQAHLLKSIRSGEEDHKLNIKRGPPRPEAVRPPPRARARRELVAAAAAAVSVGGGVR